MVGGAEATLNVVLTDGSHKRVLIPASKLEMAQVGLEPAQTINTDIFVHCVSTRVLRLTLPLPPAARIAGSGREARTRAVSVPASPVHAGGHADLTY